MVSVVGWKDCEGSVPHGLSGRMESFSWSQWSDGKIVRGVYHMVSVVGWKDCEGSVPHGLSGRMESFSECGKA